MTDIVEYFTDYQNPLVSYAYLIVIALALRAFLIVIPLIRIAVKYYRKGMLKNMLRLKKLAALKGIEGFIIAEIIVMLLPGLIAIIVRYGFLGPAPELNWTNEQIMLGLTAGALWLIVDINQTIKTRKSLVTVLNWYENPGQVNKILDDILWTRERLDKVSKWQIESNQQDEIVDVETNESTISKIGGFLSSTFESMKLTVQTTLKDVAEAGVRRIDSTLQKKVDEVVADSPPRRWKSFAIDLTCSIWPFALIYYFLPLLI